MKKKLQKLLKNQKGLTLVELLAVVVILGIIAAIAVPSIAGIIDNSKKDAHIANAEQMIGAARLAVAANDVNFTKSTTNGSSTYTATLTLSDLTSKGYLEQNLEDPDKSGSAYPNTDNSRVVITKTLGNASKAGEIVYKVALIGNERSIGSATETFLPGDLDRSDVK
ncbi:type II secretion system protein [Peribacillus asahii]|uniref:type II secretion system protein n=1 Tax=Peribacillus asahii TaxID=228899 RepID=UPI00381FCDFA